MQVTQNRDSMKVGCMDPAGWGNGNEMMAEVDKNINDAPLNETICLSV